MRVWIVSGKHAIFVALKQAKYDFSCLYLSTKEYDKALRNSIRLLFSASLEALAADDSETSNTLALYNILTKACAHSGNASKAAEYIDKLQDLQSSWSYKNYQSAIREMEVKYETEKKEHEIAQQKNIISRQNMQRGLLGAGAGVMLLGLAVSLLLWRGTVQKRRLAEQQVKQLEKEKQLVATQAVLDGEVQERTRLARDLHDGLGSILAAAKYNLSDVKKSFRLDAAGVERLDRAVTLLDDSMREMRRVAHHLMPDTLSHSGLKQSITDFCNTIPIVKFNYYGDESRLEPNLEVMVYRIMHELVSNALKHSGASHIIVQLIRDANNIMLIVQDNGCGFEPAVEHKGMGLNNIRTRVAAYNGNLLVDSKAGTGTEINVEFPI